MSCTSSPAGSMTSNRRRGRASTRTFHRSLRASILAITLARPAPRSASPTCVHASGRLLSSTTASTTPGKRPRLAFGAASSAATTDGTGGR
eukprot:5594666-Prymnesium_polylepis.1